MSIRYRRCYGAALGLYTDLNLKSRWLCLTAYRSFLPVSNKFAHAAGQGGEMRLLFLATDDAGLLDTDARSGAI